MKAPKPSLQTVWKRAFHPGHKPKHLRKVRKKSWNKWDDLTAESDRIMRLKLQRDAAEGLTNDDLSFSKESKNNTTSQITEEQTDNIAEDIEEDSSSIFNEDYRRLFKEKNGSAKNYSEILKLDRMANLQELFPENSQMEANDQLLFVEPHLHFEGSLPHSLMEELCDSIGISDYYESCFRPIECSRLLHNYDALFPLSNPMELPHFLLPHSLDSSLDPYNNDHSHSSHSSSSKKRWSKVSSDARRAIQEGWNVNHEMAKVSNLIRRQPYRSQHEYLALIERCVREIGFQQWENRVLYTEMRIAPHRLTTELCNDPQIIMKSVIKGMADCRDEYGIEMRPIICGIKGMSFAKLKECVRMAYNLRNDDKRLPLGCVGLDIISSGTESINFQTKLISLQQSMIQARKLGVHRTAHIGQDEFGLPLMDTLLVKDSPMHQRLVSLLSSSEFDNKEGFQRRKRLLNDSDDSESDNSDDEYDDQDSDDEELTKFAGVSRSQEWRMTHVKNVIHNMNVSNRVSLPMSYPLPRHILHRLFQRQAHMEYCMPHDLQRLLLLCDDIANQSIKTPDSLSSMKKTRNNRRRTKRMMMTDEDRERNEECKVLTQFMLDKGMKEFGNYVDWITLNGMNFTINSDCPTIYNVSLQTQYRQWRSLDLLNHDFTQTVFNGLRSSFLDEHTKSVLMFRLRQSWKTARPESLINLDSFNFADSFEDRSFDRDELLDKKQLYYYFESAQDNSSNNQQSTTSRLK